jgi:hypothetical protein
LLERKRYTAGEIEQVLLQWPQPDKRKQIVSQADERTLRRWWREYQEKLPGWIAGLRMQRGHSTEPPNLFEMSLHLLIQLAEVLAVFPLSRRRRSVLGMAAAILSSHPYCPA